MDRTHYLRQWKIDNNEKFRAGVVAAVQRVKREVLEHYGGKPPVCACCDEDGYVFLTIDHKNGKGAAHRKKFSFGGGTGIYYWLKRSGFPDGFQILCFNCNFAKGTGHECPHKTGKTHLSRHL